jgi:hypothetical protein
MINSKVCKYCGETKSEEEFYPQQQKGNNGQVWKYLDCYCKPCRNSYSYNRRKNMKDKAVEYKGGQCVDCGIKDISDIFDFHHEDPSLKDFSIGKKANVKFETIKKELDKCILLCSNCHRKRHAKVL